MTRKSKRSHNRPETSAYETAHPIRHMITHQSSSVGIQERFDIIRRKNLLLLDCQRMSSSMQKQLKAEIAILTEQLEAEGYYIKNEGNISTLYQRLPAQTIANQLESVQAKLAKEDQQQKILMACCELSSVHKKQVTFTTSFVPSEKPIDFWTLLQIQAKDTLSFFNNMHSKKSPAL